MRRFWGGLLLEIKLPGADHSRGSDVGAQELRAAIERRPSSSIVESLSTCFCHDPNHFCGSRIKVMVGRLAREAAADQVDEVVLICTGTDTGS
jgi:hypothetical protein